ncbi:hypothetical protein EDD85DRAFT_240665 [Armillaria nabsnona]|nr:hypothetical protein EDD85DRAFT_240665 [Armillaria nabsnona]
MLFLCSYFCLSFCRIVQTIPLISGAVSISGRKSEHALLGYTYNRPFVTVVRRKGTIFPIPTARCESAWVRLPTKCRSGI